MSATRRGFTLGSLALGACATGQAPVSAQQEGPFEANWESLISNYRAPDWFRDAKLGLWAHWSAQCVPEQGDWYARHMYMQGHPDYEHHVRTYGHPSEVGFMEMNNRWKAENWNPEALMQRYKAAGAKYFVALANHHDNFDNYNSRHHEWHSVNVGPKKDLVGIWAAAARSNGLRFGVSNHSAHAWHWFQTAYNYDPEGAMAGVRYDAHRLRRADGAGKWWEGLDPQALYTGPNIVPPNGINSIREMNAWNESQNRLWVETPPAQNPDFTARWRLRCLDLIDSYNPDLLYFDNFDLPLGQAGLDVAAHYYNANMARRGGALEAVLNAKLIPGERRRALVEDVERGAHADIMPDPWQTDTCLGAWHYKRSIFEEKTYKSATWVIHSLADIVSKNGNLLLSVPMRGDGTIDSEEEKVLDGMAAWIAVNGDAIFGTRPWRRFGEGPSQVAAGMFQEGAHNFTGADIRFTQKAGAVYAIVLGWPDRGRVRVESLAQGAPGEIERVELLGSGELPFERTGSALTVTMPARRRGEIAYALKINGRGLERI